jgi:DNA primase
VPSRWRAAVDETAPAVDPRLLLRRQQEVVVAPLLNHTFLLGEFEEEISALELPARDLDRLCREILKAHASCPDLDAARLRSHLGHNGYEGAVEGVLSQQVLNHAAFARADADAATVRAGFKDVIRQFQRRSLATEIKEAERALAADTSDATWARVQPLLNATHDEDDDGTTEGGLR